jgi:hypothetical protein
MNAYAHSTDDFSRRMEEVMDTVSAEMRHAAAYVETVVIPEVRRESSGALRLLAGHMERLAERLHPQSPPQGERP